jgi:hypothetical protein
MDLTMPMAAAGEPTVLEAHGLDTKAFRKIRRRIFGSYGTIAL